MFTPATDFSRTCGDGIPACDNVVRREFADCYNEVLLYLKKALGGALMRYDSRILLGPYFA